MKRHHHRDLKPGDRIRFLSVPQGDLDQRVREIQSGLEDAGWTADTIERIIAQDPVVTIAWVDEYGPPWFEYAPRGDNGEIEEHAIAITEDQSWERVA